MMRASAAVRTQHGSKYVAQLCKHWSHKLEVETSTDTSVVRFPAATAIMRPDGVQLALIIEAHDEDVLERMKEVLARHLDRFAFREAPLEFRWSAA